MKRILTVLLLVGLVAGSAGAVVDPFYRNRMESGLRAFERADWEAAARQLRIACFGFLDEPVELVGGLVRLAVAEAALGDDDAFRRIVSRLIEIEERFSAYSSARLPESLRRRFEQQAARLVPPESLRTTPGFRSIAKRAAVQRLADMPPELRRSELEARIAAEPERVDWQLELVRLELEVRRPQQALELLDRLPPEAATMPPATCYRQQAATESGACERMDLGQPFCRDVPPDVVEFRLECLVDAASWPEAAGLLAGLGPELRSRRRIVRLKRRVERNLGEEATLPPPATPAATTLAERQPPPAAPETASPAPEPAESASGELPRLRERLDAARTADELATLRAEAERFAERHPDSRRGHLLTGEIAYLQADWPAAVRWLRRAGELRPDEADLAFYLAVALYESGDPEAAAEVLEPVAPRLEKSGFVTTYMDRILAPNG